MKLRHAFILLFLVEVFAFFALAFGSSFDTARPVFIFSIVIFATLLSLMGAVYLLHSLTKVTQEDTLTTLEESFLEKSLQEHKPRAQILKELRSEGFPLKDIHKVVNELEHSSIERMEKGH